jgi:hypothetical protein
MKTAPVLLAASWVGAVLLLQACSGGASGLEATAQALSLKQTEVALQGTSAALAAAETALAASPTPSPRPPTATARVIPSATPGPAILYDGFDVNDGRWSGCSHCRYDGGELLIGPYEPSEGIAGFPVVCGDCGLLTDFDLAVDARFVDGYSDRGFGLLLRYEEESGRYLDLELTTWQVFGAWSYDPGLKAWGVLGTGWQYAPSMFPSYHDNHVEVQARGSRLQVDLNGVTVHVYEDLPAGPAQVGLIVGFHSIQAAFDNFLLTVYGDGVTPPGGSG